MLTYNGYEGSIEYSEDNGYLFGKVQFINDLLMYEGETLQELTDCFQDAVDQYIETCAIMRKQPDKPDKPLTSKVPYVIIVI